LHGTPGQRGAGLHVPQPPPPLQAPEPVHDTAQKYSALMQASSWIHTPCVRLNAKDAFLLGGHISGLEALFVRCVCRDCLRQSTSGRHNAQLSHRNSICAQCECSQAGLWIGITCQKQDQSQVVSISKDPQECHNVQRLCIKLSMLKKYLSCSMCRPLPPVLQQADKHAWAPCSLQVLSFLLRSGSHTP